MTTSAKRWALTAGSAGLAAGLALGATSLASAESTPAPSDKRMERPMGHERGPGHQKLKHQMRGGGGLVSAVGADSLTVRTPKGDKVIALTKDTTYYAGKVKASKSIVKTGGIVHVRLVDPRAASPVAAVVTVLPAHLGGWVTKVEGNTLTLTDHGGFTRTVRTSNATTYVKDGEAATAAAVTVGTMIRASGVVAEDGTTLLANRVAVGRPDGAHDKADREKADREVAPPA